MMSQAELETLLTGHTWKMVARWRNPQATDRIADQPENREEAFDWGSLPPETYTLSRNGHLWMKSGKRYEDKTGTWEVVATPGIATQLRLSLRYKYDVHPVVREYDILDASPKRVFTLPATNDKRPPIYCEFAPVSE